MVMTRNHRPKHLILKGIHTAQCFGIKLMGTVPQGGFKAFADICRKHRLQWNPMVKMWFVRKDRFMLPDGSEDRSKVLTLIADCNNEVVAFLRDSMGVQNIQVNMLALTSPPKPSSRYPAKKDPSDDGTPT